MKDKNKMYHFLMSVIDISFVIMDLNFSRLSIPLVPKLPHCVVYATRRQVHRRFDAGTIMFPKYSDLISLTQTHTNRDK